ncbi:hypothetical protein HN992_03630 [Candidatus Woesearchaeota archaeon]|nr:hypothetical protein [Candidatus Woesearchaeota archaeon]MBT3439093.1 hypothetical protein [Candidatus Woesearchaeota archaeon]MBT4058083.1 hypothetical protein [Candidatus Woesearchaeota archaeon]MBT4207718.1 hypothetical protein [Candidatus Woesearchaeota archaeon]MBT4732508.1 hypothetical protein [Candidatus Woesearchaeota archaeon]
MNYLGFEGMVLPVLFYFLIFWDSVWKGIAMWKAGRNNQLAWFVSVFILNTAGILPIIYLLFFRKNKVKKSRKK